MIKLITHFMAVALILHLFLYAGCKSTVFSVGTVKDPPMQGVKIAIRDFLQTDPLHPTATIFSVGVSDIDSNLLGVSIIPSVTKILINANTVVGEYGNVPSRFFEEDGKLFYWHDDQYPLTAETLSTYNRYDVIDFDSTGYRTMPEFMINDDLKGAHYYLCKQDYSVYRKVVTDKAMGYYNRPRVRCL